MPKKGYKQTSEHKLKLAHAKFKKGNDYKGFMGKQHSEEFKEHQSNLKKKDNPMFQKDARKKVSESRMGAKNWKWKGGISFSDNDPRYTFEYKEWRRQVFKRDQYACIKCGAKSSKGSYTYLTAHHVREFSKYPELRHDINNGITLCIQCHCKITGHEMLKNNKGYRRCL
jgi:hypothetical protein